MAEPQVEAQTTMSAGAQIPPFTPTQRIMVKTTADNLPLFQGVLGKIPVQKMSGSASLNNQVFHQSGVRIDGTLFVLEASLLAREMGETGWKLCSYSAEGRKSQLGQKRPPKSRELDDFLVDAVVDHFLKDRSYPTEPLIQVFVAQL